MLLPCHAPFYSLWLGFIPFVVRNNATLQPQHVPSLLLLCTAAVSVNGENISKPCLLLGANDLALGEAELHLWYAFPFSFPSISRLLVPLQLLERPPCLLFSPSLFLTKSFPPLATHKSNHATSHDSVPENFATEEGLYELQQQAAADTSRSTRVLPPAPMQTMDAAVWRTWANDVLSFVLRGSAPASVRSSRPASFYLDVNHSQRSGGAPERVTPEPVALEEFSRLEMAVAAELNGTAAADVADTAVDDAMARADAETEIKAEDGSGGQAESGNNMGDLLEESLTSAHVAAAYKRWRALTQGMLRDLCTVDMEAFRHPPADLKIAIGPLMLKWHRLIGLIMAVEKMRCKDVHLRFDTDNDGRVSRSDIYAASRYFHLGFNPYEANALFDALDTNNDNGLDQAEFAAHVRIVHLPSEFLPQHKEDKSRGAHKLLEQQLAEESPTRFDSRSSRKWSRDSLPLDQVTMRGRTASAGERSRPAVSGPSSPEAIRRRNSRAGSMRQRTAAGAPTSTTGGRPAAAGTSPLGPSGTTSPRGRDVGSSSLNSSPRSRRATLGPSAPQPAATAIGTLERKRGSVDANGGLGMHLVSPERGAADGSRIPLRRVSSTRGAAEQGAKHTQSEGGQAAVPTEAGAGSAAIQQRHEDAPEQKAQAPEGAEDADEGKIDSDVDENLLGDDDDVDEFIQLERTVGHGHNDDNTTAATIAAASSFYSEPTMPEDHGDGEVDESGGSIPPSPKKGSSASLWRQPARDSYATALGHGAGAEDSKKARANGYHDSTASSRQGSVGNDLMVPRDSYAAAVRPTKDDEDGSSDLVAPRSSYAAAMQPPTEGGEGSNGVAEEDTSDDGNIEALAEPRESYAQAMPTHKGRMDTGAGGDGGLSTVAEAVEALDHSQDTARDMEATSSPGGSADHEHEREPLEVTL